MRNWQRAAIVILAMVGGMSTTTGQTVSNAQSVGCGYKGSVAVYKHCPPPHGPIWIKVRSGSWFSRKYTARCVKEGITELNDGITRDVNGADTTGVSCLASEVGHTRPA